ncbi:hypothetical protein ACGK9R_05815 [Halomonas sp. HNIBRBA4712]|uniref:hypothetical protein n=1 Tax=Halomonas sp. HNIBRBA4712 TaxID=3373087 RepID=UPI0037465A26
MLLEAPVSCSERFLKLWQADGGGQPLKWLKTALMGYGFGTKYWDKSKNKKPRNRLIYGAFLKMAEGQGFEPWIGY